MYLIVQISCILDSIRIIRRLTVRIVRNILGQGLRVTLALLAFKVLKVRKVKREPRVQRVRKDQKVTLALLVKREPQVQELKALQRNSIFLLPKPRKLVEVGLRQCLPGLVENIFGPEIRLFIIIRPQRFTPRRYATVVGKR